MEWDASVPEVDCPKHVVFAHRSTECPGCANEVAAYRHYLAGEARTFYYTEYARAQAEVDEQRRQHVEQLSAAQARLDAHDRANLVFPDSRSISQLEVDQRDQDDLDTRRAELAARVANIGHQIADFELQRNVRTVAVRVMMTMTDTMREATELFIAEDQREEEEKLAAQRATAVVAVACADLDRQYGGTHTMGPPGTEYTNLRLLGAVDIAGKRYARLEWYEGSWACVPWIDAFAELVGQKISVVWNNDIKNRANLSRQRPRRHYRLEQRHHQPG